MTSPEQQAVIEALIDRMRDHGEAFAERYMTDSLDPERMARLSLELWAVGLLLLGTVLEALSPSELTEEAILEGLLDKFGREATLFVRLREASYRLPAGAFRSAIDTALSLQEGPLNGLVDAMNALLDQLPVVLPSFGATERALAERFAACLDSQGFELPLSPEDFLSELTVLMGDYRRDFEAAFRSPAPAPFFKGRRLAALALLLAIGVGAGVYFSPAMRRPSHATGAAAAPKVIRGGVPLNRAVAALKKEGWEELREASGIPSVPYDSALALEGHQEADGQAYPALLFTRMAQDDPAPQELVIFLKGRPGGFQVLDLVEAPPPSLLNYFYRTTMGREKEEAIQEALHFVGASAVRVTSADESRYALDRADAQDVLVASSGGRWALKYAGTPPEGDYDELFLSADSGRLAVLWVDEAAGCFNLLKFARTPAGIYEEAHEEGVEEP